MISSIRFSFFHSYRLKGKNTRNIVLLGSFEINEIKEIKKDGLHYGYNFIKILDKQNKYIKELKLLLKNESINYVFLYETDENNINHISAFCDDYGLRLKIILPFSISTGKRAGLDTIAGFPLMDIRHEPLLYLGNKLAKRTIDILIALISIILVLTWLPIIVKIAQTISYPGPLFFTQDRIGRNGNKIKLFKFRTMYISDEIDIAKEGFSTKTNENDLRIPFFGKLLRSTNLDEYPQFINVLFGSMSTVGPRPYMVGEDLDLEKNIPRYRMRRFVKPGITGLAAINGYRGGTNNIKLMKKRTEYDILYLENWNLLLDIKIIFITMWQMGTFKIPKAY